MRFYFHKTPPLLRRIYPGFTWNFPADKEQKRIYLTFDDGPCPEITPYILELLDRYGAKVTFFVVGRNVEQNSDLIPAIVNNEHSIGNHTYNHLNGWKTDTSAYLDDIKRCDKILDHVGYKSDLFRPPHGRITHGQAKQVLKTKNIVMWSHLSGDFDDHLDIERSKRQLSDIGSGSILLFHDNIKFRKNLKLLLPWVLKEYSERGFIFKSV